MEKQEIFESYKKTFAIINQKLKTCKNQKEMYELLFDGYELLLNMQSEIGFDELEYRIYAMGESKKIRNLAGVEAYRTGKDKFDKLHDKLLLLEARNKQVDSGLLYLEKNRVSKERFYEPRREVFMKHNIIQSLQDLMDDKIDLFALSVPPGCGKTSLEIFFLTLVGGWFPNDFNLSSAHSSILTRSIYDGINEIIDDPVEYTWHEIFPNVKVQGTNAKETTINLERAGRFKTWTMRSIDGSLTGATRCNRFLTADDMVSGIEEALNKARLNTLWTKVVNDLRSRRLDKCKEIYIATRWSVHDPIGKIEKRYADNPRARFIAIPALDENGESNFNYEINGFSKEYFEDQREMMDEISFNCLYMQKAVEREGLLLNPDELRRFYFSEDEVPEGETNYIIVPERNPDAIWAVCDTKDIGTDFESMPIIYQYDNDFLIMDVVFDDSTDYTELDKKTANMLIKHNPHKIVFESNNAGSRVAYNVQQLIDGEIDTEIETRHTQANKETKILANSGWIKKNMVFAGPSLYKPKSDYGAFVGNVVSYTTKAKVPHDDGIDSLATFSEIYREMTGRDEDYETVVGRRFI